MKYTMTTNRFMLTAELICAIALTNAFADFYDNDGKAYKTVNIGDQTWTAENLDYNVKGSACYGNNPANCDKYGRLYDWETALEICPEGWHLPTNKEWNKLIEIAGGEAKAGKYLKARKGWNNNGNGSGTYGFSALPGGSSYSGGSFEDSGNYGYWWSATEFDSDRAYGRYMDSENERTLLYYGNKLSLRSVRCIKD